MKISRERIAQINDLGVALSKEHSRHCLECAARDDLLTALDERDELIAKAREALRETRNHCGIPCCSVCRRTSQTLQEIDE